jgi:hypothetical protein
VADNPVSTIAAARTIAEAIPLTKIEPSAGSSFTLAASMDNYTIEGSNYTMNLGSQSVSDATIMGATITGGTSTAANAPIFDSCVFDTAITLVPGIYRNSFFGDATFTLLAGNYFINHCIDRASGAAVPVFDFGVAAVNTELNVHDWAGGIEVQNMGQAGTDEVAISGSGRIIFNANCTGGTAIINPTIKVTNSGSVTVTNNGVSNDVSAILVDTAEIGTAGAGLTEAGATGDHLTAVPWNAAWDAEVQSEVTDALNAYDPPTKAELDTAHSTTDALITTVDTVVDGIQTDLDNATDGLGAIKATADAIEVDTQDLQTQVGTAGAGLTAVPEVDANMTKISGTAAAADNLEASMVTGGVIPGAAVTGTLTTTVATSNLTGYADDQLIGRVIVVTSGNAQGEATDITDYASTGGTLTFTALTTAMGNGDTFVIV